MGATSSKAVPSSKLYLYAQDEKFGRPGYHEAKDAANKVTTTDPNATGASTVNNNNGVSEDFYNALNKSYHDEYSKLLKSDLEKYYGNTMSIIDSDYEAALDSLRGAHRSFQNSVSKQVRDAQQVASVSLDKLKKYLPTQIKRQGLDGLGVSETAAIRANNAYVNQMGEISENAAEKLKEYESNMRSQLDTLAAQRTQAKLNAYGNYVSGLNNVEDLNLQRAQLYAGLEQYQDGVKRDEKAILDTTQEKNFNIALGMLDAGEFSTAAEAQAYVDGLNVSDEQRKTLQVKVNFIGQMFSDSEVAPVQAVKVTGGNNKKFESGEKISVFLNGDEKKLVSAGAVYNEEIKVAAENIEPNTVFYYEGLLYYKKSDGGIVSIEEDKKDYHDIHTAVYGKGE